MTSYTNSLLSDRAYQILERFFRTQLAEEKRSACLSEAGGVLCGPVPPGAAGHANWRLVSAQGRGQPASQPANLEGCVARWSIRHNSLMTKVLVAAILRFAKM